MLFFEILFKNRNYKKRGENLHHAVSSKTDATGNEYLFLLYH